MKTELQEKLEYIEKKIKEIQSDVTCMLQDLEEAKELEIPYDELFLIQQAFERIEGKANIGYNIIMEMYDLIGEEE